MADSQSPRRSHRPWVTKGSSVWISACSDSRTTSAPPVGEASVMQTSEFRGSSQEARSSGRKLRTAASSAATPAGKARTSCCLGSRAKA
eukprot:13961733-Alexandrium_andersonii.AAC.1